jgi:hypothetical protein
VGTARDLASPFTLFPNLIFSLDSAKGEFAYRLVRTASYPTNYLAIMAVGQLKSLIGSIRRKPSTAPDRRSKAETNGVNGEKTSLMSDLSSIGVKNMKMLGGALVDMASGEPLDDKELRLENGVAMLQSLPSNSGLASAVSNGFIGSKYKWRRSCR